MKVTAEENDRRNRKGDLRKRIYTLNRDGQLQLKIVMEEDV